MSRNETGSFPFEGWTARQINYVLRSINENLPADKCGTALNDAQKKWYEEARSKLAEENKNYDHWVIGYDMMELETE